MTWYERVIAAHTAVTKRVSHGQRMRADRYFVWQETGANDLTVDNIHAERRMTGTTDLFTKKEFDPWAAALEKQFDASGIAWELVLIELEDDTGFWHWSWDWEA